MRLLSASIPGMKHNCKQLLESLILVTNLKRLLNFIKQKWNTAWKACDSLHAWLVTQSRLIAMVSSLIARLWVRPHT